MKKKALKILTVLLAIVFALGIAGCSGNKADNQPSATGGGDSGSNASGGGDAELVIWHPNGLRYPDDMKKEDTLLYKQFAKFEAENPGTRVVEVNQPTENFYELLKAANTAGSGPDIVALWPGAPTTDYSDFLLPLDSYISAEMRNDLFGWEMAEKDGVTYGIPIVSYTYCTFYNKSMFAEAGISKAPETWDELISACEALKAAGITPFYVGAKDGYVAQWSAGAILTNVAGPDQQSTLDGKLVGGHLEEALTLWASLYENGYMNEDLLSVNALDEMAAGFVAGKGAMIFSGGNWDAPTIVEAMGDNVGIIKVPAAGPPENAKFNYAGPGMNLSITNYSKNPDLAFKLIESLLEPEFIIAYGIEQGEMPTNNSIDKSLFIGTPLEPFYDIIGSGTISVATLDMLPEEAQMTLWRLGGLVTTGRMPPEELCLAMEDVIKNAQ